MTHTNTEGLSDERLAKMLEGLDDVTPGPWLWGARYIGVGDVMRGNYAPIAQTPDGMIAPDGEQWDANAAHIARCDPDTIRYLVTQELSRRSASNTGGVEVKALEWRGPFEAFPSTMWEAETPFGRYEIEEQNASDSPVYELRFNMKVVAIKDGVPEIQECAQADFNQRILSAIVSSSVSAEVTVTRQMLVSAYLAGAGSPDGITQHEAAPHAESYADAALASINGGRENG